MNQQVNPNHQVSLKRSNPSETDASLAGSHGGHLGYNQQNPASQQGGDMVPNLGYDASLGGGQGDLKRRMFG